MCHVQQRWKGGNSKANFVSLNYQVLYVPLLCRADHVPIMFVGQHVVEWQRNKGWCTTKAIVVVWIVISIYLSFIWNICSCVFRRLCKAPCMMIWPDWWKKRAGGVSVFFRDLAHGALPWARPPCSEVDKHLLWSSIERRPVLPPFD